MVGGAIVRPAALRLGVPPGVAHPGIALGLESRGCSRSSFSKAARPPEQLSAGHGSNPHVGLLVPGWAANGGRSGPPLHQ
jgi:hypothetical protein